MDLCLINKFVPKWHVKIERNEKQTSENVNDAVLFVLRLAKMIADTDSLELVAKGNAINEMKNVGILVASEKLSTASTRGSANAAAIMVPTKSISTALTEVHLRFSTASTTSSLCSLAPNKLCSLFVSCSLFARCHNLIEISNPR